MKKSLNLTPKTYMASLLIGLAIICTFQQGHRNFLHLVLAPFFAIVLDLIFYYLRTKKLIFPSSVFITGMIIALVLDPQNKWFIPVVASIIAITQKHIIRHSGKHIFNPANFGLLAVMFIFSTHPVWWAQNMWSLIILAGLFICYRIKRLELSFTFIATFSLLFILNNLFAKQPLSDSIFLINIFFVFVMLIEPKTSPVARKGQIIFAIIVALFSFIIFKFTPQYDFSILALALGNVFAPFLNKLK